MDQKWQIIPISGTMFQDGSAVTEYDSPGEEKPRTRRVACTCPNCCDGEKRYLNYYYFQKKNYFYLSVLIIVILFIVMVLVRGYIFVTYLVVIKCMEKHLIYVLILDGTRVNDLLFVTGNTVVNDLLDQMNFRYKIILKIYKL